MKTTGNLILITGGSSGIGLALAKKFLATGNRVITADRNPDKQAAALAAVPGLQGVICDLTKQEDIDRLVLEIEQQHPDLNVLINNA
ncbi:MAG: SDR family NAD(P)-dependent oxidoreductase, partial [Saprospiraceae bacterium]|nr:SDR family NAD(P)-dependent oxidoreductase [Saprospiraceae bacterium]